MVLNIRFFLIFTTFFIGVLLHAQSWCDSSRSAIKERAYDIIAVLSHDSLKGREAGTYQDSVAAAFIADIFRETGLYTVLENHTYKQPFKFINGIKVTKNNSFSLNDIKLDYETDFWPLNMSANKKTEGPLIHVGYGIEVPQHNYNDYADLSHSESAVFVIKTGMPDVLKDKDLPPYYSDLDFKISTAIGHGASGIIFIKSEDGDDEVPELFNWHYRQAVDVPVIYADGRAAEMIKSKTSWHAKIAVELETEVRTSYNVIGYLDNDATSTIVIGGHYDHLGTGSPISRHRGAPAIHPGADDNASGVAATIELARLLVCQGYMKHNVLFIAFGAEEKGLLGSHYFVNSEAYDLTKINFMLNMDMVGRLDNDTRKLHIIGTGSSPVWDSIIDITPADHFHVNKSASASGGSDHINFYLKDLPVLFFFTGIHEDYHKPADVIDKINFDGFYYIIKYVNTFISNVDTLILPFSQAPLDQARGQRRSATVALGIMPDHAYSGKGLKVADVVSDGPAENAGIMRNDIIVKMDTHKVRDIYEYMHALNKLEQGQKIKVIIMRNDQQLSIDVLL